MGKHEYFGQYGSILKIVVNKTKAYNPNGPNGPSYSAYISYATEEEASIAILAIDNIEVDEHILRASYGTTKYCTFFLKNSDCPNKDCLYLHHMANESDIINREEMNSNTNIFYEQQLLAMKIADIFNTNVKKKLKTLNTKKKCIFPTTDTIYTKDIVIEQNNEYHDYKIYDNSNFKGKKKYCDDYYNNYYKNRGYSESYNGEDYFYEDENYGDATNLDSLTREKSEQFSAKHSQTIKCKSNTMDMNDNQTCSPSVGKFISKSKSPITNKKKTILNSNDINLKDKPIINSLSPKKLELQERSSDDNDKATSSESKNHLFSSSNKQRDSNDTTSNQNSVKSKMSPAKRLYSKRDKSRFDFVMSKSETKDVNNIKIEPKVTSLEINSNTIEDNEYSEVPDYVFNVISKKISRHTFFRKFEKEFEKEDCEYTFFKNQLNSNDSWSKFILANLHKECKNKI